MPWAKSNKTSWRNDHYNAGTLKSYFGEKKLKEIQPLDVERFKSKRLATKTKHDTQRAPASVNREFELLSRVYNLAIEVGKADSNPCLRVKKFKLDNERYRFLTPTEEADLMSSLVSPREHLGPMVIVALGLGLRKQEQLKLRCERAFGTACDLAELRNLEWHDLRAAFCTRLAIAGMTHSRSKC